jgi:hypothetical protein
MLVQANTVRGQPEAAESRQPVGHPTTRQPQLDYPSGHRQMSIVADLEQHRQHLRRRITDRDAVPEEPPNRSQDPIDPARAAHRW